MTIKIDHLNYPVLTALIKNSNMSRLELNIIFYILWAMMQDANIEEIIDSFDNISADMSKIIKFIYIKHREINI